MGDPLGSPRVAPLFAAASSPTFIFPPGSLFFFFPMPLQRVSRPPFVADVEAPAAARVGALISSSGPGKEKMARNVAQSAEF